METKVLTNWKPSKLDNRTIRVEFTELVESLGFSVEPQYGVEARDPEAGIIAHKVSDVGKRWHRDGTGIYQEHVVIWSNILPTEVLLPNGSLLEAKDGDVILLENQAVMHRIPAEAVDHPDRWFARAWVANLKEQENEH